MQHVIQIKRSYNTFIRSKSKTICIDQFYFYPGQQDALDNLIEVFGVYAETVDIAFDEEELSDSDGGQDQQTHGEEEDDQAHDDDEDEQPHNDEVNDQPHHDEAPYRKKEITIKQRRDIFKDLLRTSNNGRLKKNSTTIIAAKYNVHICTVRRVWQRAKKCWAHGIAINVDGLKPNNCGRKKIEVELSTV